MRARFCVYIDCILVGLEPWFFEKTGVLDTATGEICIEYLTRIQL